MTSLAAIHVARKQLGLDDDTARDLYARVTGKRSLREMNAAEHQRVVEELRRQGFTKASSGSRRHVEGPYAKKLTALWIAMWHLGLVRDRSDDALVAFVLKRVNVDHTRWLTDAVEGRKVVEALKDWIAREAGVDWNARGRDYLKHDAAKVAWAQWKILHPEAALDDQAFTDAVWRALGRPQSLAGHTLSVLSAWEWQTVNRAWGAAVRKARAR